MCSQQPGKERKKKKEGRVKGIVPKKKKKKNLTFKGKRAKRQPDRAVEQKLKCRGGWESVASQRYASALFEHLKCAAAPTADQRQRSGSALAGIKSH